ncbi:MAG: hypothetical protein MHM6MM_007077 [Cercozoa sp. M6MM]
MLRSTLVLLGLVASATACIVHTVQGDSFDLSSATNNGLGWSHQEMFLDDTFTLHLSLCGPPKNDTLEHGGVLPSGLFFAKCPTYTGSIFQVDEVLNRCDGSTGSWNKATVYTLDMNKKRGIEIHYQHDSSDGLDSCVNSIESKWIVECTKKEEAPVFTNLSPGFTTGHCVYNVRSGSPAVCKTIKPAAATDGLSQGPSSAAAATPALLTF